jgi:hypothetical protein
MSVFKAYLTKKLTRTVSFCPVVKELTCLVMEWAREGVLCQEHLDGMHATAAELRYRFTNWHRSGSGRQWRSSLALKIKIKSV